MSLIPDEELHKTRNINLAPMVDFLFLVVAVFAVLAVTRTALYDSEVELAKTQPIKENSYSIGNDRYNLIHLSITSDGKYKWITEFSEYIMASVQSIEEEISKQQELGLIPPEKEKTKILLHVDKKAQWEPVIELIVGIKRSGFSIHPVYESLDQVDKQKRNYSVLINSSCD